MEVDRNNFQSEAYKEKVRVVKEFVEKNFSKSLENFIREKNWNEKPDLTTNVINDNLNSADLNYLDEKLRNLSHLRDRRSTPEYACDLILGWVMEDGILKILTENLNINCQLSSADKEREFISKPKATSDIRIETDPQETKLLEVVKDYTGYWMKNKKIDLRNGKYKNLKRENGILLGLDFKNGYFFIFEIKDAKAKYIESHWPYGGKPAYSISLAKVKFHKQGDMKRILGEFFRSASSS